ncbi:MAG TPA: DUF433 domain-containing protein [Kiritimatiellia bacterium]|nr:DUF433 domain-containing protein [Kiritimatiellia bacterium]
MRKIVVNSDICNGRPTFEGTRITVQTILEFLGAGDSHADILRAYPALSEEDLLEALRFSGRLLGHHFIVREVA